MYLSYITFPLKSISRSNNDDSGGSDNNEDDDNENENDDEDGSDDDSELEYITIGKIAVTE